jgi:soluble lytic murein transglycosylase-like protein
MKSTVVWLHLACAFSLCYGQANQSRPLHEAEYYVAAYAQHYRVPAALVRAIIKQESDWQPCVVSSKGAVGLMQLMPGTAARLGVADRCSIDQNVSAGIRYLAWLMQQFHGDLRLVCAAYYAGEDTIARRGLAYRNPDVFTYVRKIRDLYLHQVSSEPTTTNP